MREAMRLMQTGDLLAATAAIQQRLGGASEPESLRAGSVTDPIEGTFRVVDETPASGQRFCFRPERAKRPGAVSDPCTGRIYGIRF